MLGTEASAAGKTTALCPLAVAYATHRKHTHTQIFTQLNVTGYCPLSSKLRNFHEVCIHLVSDQFKIMIKKLFIAPR